MTRDIVDLGSPWEACFSFLLNLLALWWLSLWKQQILIEYSPSTVTRSLLNCCLPNLANKTKQLDPLTLILKLQLQAATCINTQTTHHEHAGTAWGSVKPPQCLHHKGGCGERAQRESGLSHPRHQDSAQIKPSVEYSSYKECILLALLQHLLKQILLIPNQCSWKNYANTAILQMKWQSN